MFPFLTTISVNHTVVCCQWHAITAQIDGFNSGQIIIHIYFPFASLRLLCMLIDSHPKKIIDENALTNVNVNPYLPTFDLSISEIMLGMRYYPDILKLIHQVSSWVRMGEPTPGRAVQSLSRSTCWEIPHSVSEVVFWHGIQCFFSVHQLQPLVFMIYSSSTFALLLIPK